jgi:hypothetical protein
VPEHKGGIIVPSLTGFGKPNDPSGQPLAFGEIVCLGLRILYLDGAWPT